MLCNNGETNNDCPFCKPNYFLRFVQSRKFPSTTSSKVIRIMIASRLINVIMWSCCNGFVNYQNEAGTYYTVQYIQSPDIICSFVYGGKSPQSMKHTHVIIIRDVLISNEHPVKMVLHTDDTRKICRVRSIKLLMIVCHFTHKIP